MKIIHAACEISYAGRGDTFAPLAPRVIMVKEDGSVAVHSDVGFKPTNYMTKAEFTEEITEDGKLLWIFFNKNEALAIKIFNVLEDMQVKCIGKDPLVIAGTETVLQTWLSENPQAVGPNFTYLQKEFETGNGPVDLLFTDGYGLPQLVEVKRVAGKRAIDQALRYLEAVREEAPQLFSELDYKRGSAIVAALTFNPNTLAYAQKKNVQLVKISGFESPQQLSGDIEGLKSYAAHSMNTKRALINEEWVTKHFPEKNIEEIF